MRRVVNAVARGGNGLFAAAGVSLLSACATVNAPDQPIGGQVVSTEVPASAFKLSDYSAKWIPAEDLDIEMRCSLNAFTFSKWCPSDDASKERARKDIVQMSQVLEVQAVAQINSRLASRGLRDGASSSIELKPQSAYWSASGWGSGVLVNVVITDVASGQKWALLVPADTGIQILSAWAAGPQTDDYAAAFASRLDRELERAGFFK
jgi:hypothetical protein